MSHTKGLWILKYEKHGRSWPGVYEVTGGLPLEFGMDGEEGIYADNLDDLYLMAAAPELLEACKILLDYVLSENGPNCRGAQEAIQAIKNATGPKPDGK